MGFICGGLLFLVFFLFLTRHITSNYIADNVIRRLIKCIQIIGIIVYFILILIMVFNHTKIENDKTQKYGLMYEKKDGIINLKWNIVNKENNYYLTVLQDGKELEAFWVSGTSYSIADTFDGGIITFIVAASGTAGVSIDYVKKYNIQSIPLNPFGKINCSDVMFSWDAAYLANSYYLEVASLDGNIVRSVSVSAKKTNMEIKGLEPGRYKWAVTPETREGMKGIASDWAYFEVSDSEQQVENILGIEKDGITSTLSTSLTYPEAAVIGPDGALYISDTHSNVILRCINGTSEIYVGTLVAGKSERGFRKEYQINRPTDIIFDSEGNMLFSDYGNHRICMVEHNTGEVLAVWNHGEDVKKFYLEEDGSFTILCVSERVINNKIGDTIFKDCTFGNPVAMVREENKTIILDGGKGSVEPKIVLFIDNRLKKSIPCTAYSSALWKDKNGDIYVGEHTTIFKLNWELEKNYFGGDFANVTYITQETEDTLLVTDSDAGGVYSVNKTTGEKTLLVGSKSLSAAVTEIEERDGYLYFLDNQSGVVWRYDPKTEKTERFIGNGRNELAVIGADRLDTGLYYPAGFTTDGNGNFYISEQHHILKINKEGKVELFAGAGGRDKYGYRDGPADAALFQAIRGISFDDKTHSLYVADTYNNRIRKIKDGKVTTVAGNGMQNEPVFGIYATESPLNRPHDIIVKESDIYISDSWNNTIVRIDENGILYAVAGIPVYKVYQGEGSYSGDGGDAQKARLNTPLNMEYYDGILYVVDAFNNRIRRVDNGKIDTIIGSNKKGYDSKDSMVLNFPSAVYVNDKYIYVADTGNFLVRRYKKEYIEKLKEER